MAALPLNDAPVNIQELEEALEVEGAREIAAGFLEDVASVPQRLTNSLEANDKDGVRAAAHLLKGCCLIIYAKKTADLAAEMEQCAIANQLDNCKAALPDLLQSLKETTDCLKQYLDAS